MTFRLVCALLAGAFAAEIPPLHLPIAALRPEALRDTFSEIHNGHPHEAIDILVPRGTPILAVASGTVEKLFLSKPGGNTIYQFDETRSFCFYYAHLDRYADGLKQGRHVNAGEVIAFAGSTGNADPATPHLHFAVNRLGPGREWWKGEPLNPYGALVEAARR